MGLRFLLMAWLLLGVQGASAQPATVLRGLSIDTTEANVEHLKFDVTNSIEIEKAFTLTNPDRVVIDIPRVTGRIALPVDYRGNLIKSVRFGQFNATTSRIVLDLAAPAKVVGKSSGAPFVVELAPLTPPTSSPAVVATASPAPVMATATAPLKPGKAAKPEKPSPSLADKPLVVIDAGHGGQDPGALGIHGTHEKDVTLNYARSLREALLRTGRYRVLLTREDDRFIMLQERVAIARKAKADLFVSFHADSNPRPEARGLSIYTVSENASDDEAAALAERENKADIIPGIDLNTTDADVASILIDLTQRETMNKSALMADAVVQSMHGKITKLQKTHRFAGFRVLKAPDIPSVLIELGFLSNEVDERLLLTPAYRDLVVASVVKGIDRFRAGE